MPGPLLAAYPLRQRFVDITWDFIAVMQVSEFQAFEGYAIERDLMFDTVPTISNGLLRLTSGT